MDYTSFPALGIAAILTLAGASPAAEPPLCAGIPPDAETRELPVRPGHPYTRVVGYFVPNPLFKGKPGGDTSSARRAATGGPDPNPHHKGKPGGDTLPLMSLPYPEDLKVAARCYFPNGKLCKETCYFTDPRTNASVEHGLSREWFPNGQLHLERNYQKGLLHGVCKQWAPDGKLLGQFEMKAGTGVETVWWDNGQRRSERGRLDGGEHGRSRYFSDRGGLIDELWYRQGKLHGPTQRFDDNGKPMPPGPFGPHYYLRGEQVSREDYVAARKDDPKLPPPVEP